MALHPLDTYELTWTPDLAGAPGPLYRALADLLERDIQTGALASGTRLPPQRELARYLGVNLSTVSRAFRLCEQRGLIAASVGNGTYVASNVGASPVFLCGAGADGAEGGSDSAARGAAGGLGGSTRMVDMGAIVPLSEGNLEVKRAVERMLRRPDALDLLSYGTPQGSFTQRRAGAAWLRRAGLDVDPANVALAAGGQNALLAALGTLFSHGDRVGCDPLTYPGLMTAARLLGIHLVPVACDENGMTEEGVRHAVRTDNVKGLYVIPDFHNPTTRTMPPASRAMLASVAREEGILLVEDGINALLSEKPPAPVASYAPERTAYLSSLSKTVSPGLRCAFVYVPARFRDGLAATLYAMNITLSPLITTAAAGLIEDGLADEVAAARRQAIAERNALVDAILGGRLPDGCRGRLPGQLPGQLPDQLPGQLPDLLLEGSPTCPFRWLRLPERHADLPMGASSSAGAGFSTGADFERAAREAGVLVYGSEHFATGGGGRRPPAAVRLSIVTPPTVDDLAEGLRRLADLLRRCR